MDKEQIQNQSCISVEKNVGDVMVVGAGISGIQAALDLANSGFKVFLVDKAPAIGGHMAQLDKTFPTNDCSMCIESPKFIECERHPNIEIMTHVDVDSIGGKKGNFKVSLIKKPRYIIEDLCTGCGTCTEYCPVSIWDIYNQNLGLTKSIHTYFPQAVPAVSMIDSATCRFLIEENCNICKGVCGNKAIDFNQHEKKVEFHVGAVILALGYEVFDPKPRGDYGYGKMVNVVTALDFERILGASGPFGGELVRPFDRKPLKKIAWIQCVGSRQVVTGGNSYCSAVCCMYALKQVILTKDHNSDIEATIFHNDIRAYGKEFEQYYQRAKKLPGVQIIRSYVSIGRELPESKNVTIRYSYNGLVKEEQFDMLVLSVGLTPPQSIVKLADKFGIELEGHGFCKANGFNVLETSRPGIFVSGAFGGPKDIPDSVMQASGAAALCGQILKKRRGKLSKERIYPPERDTSKEEPKVGVFVCHCGTNIARVVDVPSVVQYASTLNHVIYAEEQLFSCSTDSERHIAEMIKEKGLNRVVVAACTPRTHGPLFQDTICETGINKYLFDMANIREHCSWVHSREKEKATEKAKDIVRMSVARVIGLHPLKTIELPINKIGLVIGGGLSGMISALSLANQGFEVNLVEKDINLGGVARRLKYTLEGLDIQAHVNNIIRKVYQNPLIHVLTKSNIIGASGYVGNFKTKVISNGKEKEIYHGITIIATGAEEYKPKEYYYGKDDRVLTLLELEELMFEGDTKIVNAKSLSIILCVGSRQDGRPYCSRICCGQAIKCALKLKEINPDLDIYIFYRDMRTYGFNEDYYRQAANKGVNFIRYEPDPDNEPQVELVEANNQSTFQITAYDPVLEKNLTIDSDVLVLGTAVLPSSDNKEISKLFKVPLSQDGFFLEAHVKLRPVDFATDGIYLCGLAHFPKYVSESISQANAAAARAATLLSMDKGKKIAVEPIVANLINEDACRGCGLCVALCPYGALEVRQTEKGRKVHVIDVACKGCGVCAATCYQHALTIDSFTDQQIDSQIDAFLNT